MQESTSNRIQFVLDFWFGKPSDVDYLKSKSFWYGNDADDRLVRQMLADDYEKAKSRQYEQWSDCADGALALIILLDQVPRNIFRDSGQAYATDGEALEVAKKIVDNGWDENQPSEWRVHVTPYNRRLIFVPTVINNFEWRVHVTPYNNHSENLEDQKRSVELFTKLGEAEHLHWAKNFYETIKTHGRFPHRDKVLGRRSNDK